VSPAPESCCRSPGARLKQLILREKCQLEDGPLITAERLRR
jgi:hypothetical protein